MHAGANWLPQNKIMHTTDGTRVSPSHTSPGVVLCCVLLQCAVLSGIIELPAVLQGAARGQGMARVQLHESEPEHAEQNRVVECFVPQFHPHLPVPVHNSHATGSSEPDLYRY